MKNTLVNNSKTLKIKSKFFIYRILTYSSFLLVPIWIQKTVDLPKIAQIFLMLFYQAFMVGQWFLLGKEIDHRYKIYFKVNSSMDRVVYRLLLGHTALMLIFYLYSFLPSDLLKHFFWGTWVVLGIYYSWPTRGKIIHESVSGQFVEFKFLDNFERTVLVLFFILFFVSLPLFPHVDSSEALKLYFDPLEKFSPILWNFISINYFPFLKFPNLFKYGWCLQFYVIYLGFFLLSVYGLFRYFFSRRLSILGLFAILSSWSFPKFLEADFGSALSTTFSSIWIWSLLWVVKSATYRTGLFIGLMGVWATTINASFALLLPLQLALLLIVLNSEKTFWFKRQISKYTVFGLIVSFVIFLSGFDSLENSLRLMPSELYSQLASLLDRKAFFVVSLLGIVLVILKLYFKNSKILAQINIDFEKFKLFVVGLAILFCYSLIFDKSILDKFGMMWIIAFFSLIPLDWIFHSTIRFRSRRNMIYVVYILICLLDSHFEGRVKIFLKLLG